MRGLHLPTPFYERQGTERKMHQAINVLAAGGRVEFYLGNYEDPRKAKEALVEWLQKAAERGVIHRTNQAYVEEYSGVSISGAVVINPIDPNIDSKIERALSSLKEGDHMFKRTEEFSKAPLLIVVDIKHLAQRLGFDTLSDLRGLIWNSPFVAYVNTEEWQEPSDLGDLTTVFYEKPPMRFIL